MIAYYRIEGCIKALTPFHIGTGTGEKKVLTKGNDAVLVGTIVKDRKKRPYFPGATLKGMVRSLLSELDDCEARSILGQITNDNDGYMGRLLIAGAYVKTAIHDDSAPYSQCYPKGSLYITARIAIDHESGAADDKKLFHNEMALPGLELDFEWRLRPDRGDSDAHNNVAKGVALLLGLQEALKKGAYLGKSKSAGYGAFRLVEDLHITQVNVTDKGLDCVPFDYDTHKITKIAAPSLAKQKNVFLICEGPFLSLDSDPGANQESNANELYAQKLSENPIIPQSASIGVLRHRATDLQQGLRDVIHNPDAKVDSSLCLEEELAKLSPVQRLFGVTGWASVVKLRAMRLEPLLDSFISVKMPGVTIDRFTGGPVHGALFFTQP